jgi:MinD-like ATPase involved in chromosome partitioning or flagellar assembly
MIISVASGKDGIGKRTIATNFAVNYYNNHVPGYVKRR